MAAALAARRSVRESAVKARFIGRRLMDVLYEYQIDERTERQCRVSRFAPPVSEPRAGCVVRQWRELDNSADRARVMEHWRPDVEAEIMMLVEEHGPISGLPRLAQLRKLQSVLGDQTQNHPGVLQYIEDTWFDRVDWKTTVPADSSCAPGAAVAVVSHYASGHRAAYKLLLASREGWHDGEDRPTGQVLCLEETVLCGAYDGAWEEDEHIGHDRLGWLAHALFRYWREWMDQHPTPPASRARAEAIIADITTSVLAMPHLLPALRQTLDPTPACLDALPPATGTVKSAGEVKVGADPWAWRPDDSDPQPYYGSLVRAKCTGRGVAHAACGENDGRTGHLIDVARSTVTGAPVAAVATSHIHPDGSASRSALFLIPASCLARTHPTRIPPPTPRPAF